MALKNRLLPFERLVIKLKIQDVSNQNEVSDVANNLNVRRRLDLRLRSEVLNRALTEIYRRRRHFYRVDALQYVPHQPPVTALIVRKHESRLKGLDEIVSRWSAASQLVFKTLQASLSLGSRRGTSELTRHGSHTFLTHHRMNYEQRSQLLENGNSRPHGAYEHTA